MENIQQTAAFQGSWYASKGNFLISNHGSVQNKKQGVGGPGWRVTFLEQNTKHTASLRASRTFSPFKHVGFTLQLVEFSTPGKTSQHNRLSPWQSGHSDCVCKPVMTQVQGIRLWRCSDWRCLHQVFFAIILSLREPTPVCPACRVQGLETYGFRFQWPVPLSPATPSAQCTVSEVLAHALTPPNHSSVM